MWIRAGKGKRKDPKAEASQSPACWSASQEVPGAGGKLERREAQKCEVLCLTRRKVACLTVKSGLLTATGLTLVLEQEAVGVEHVLGALGNHRGEAPSPGAAAPMEGGDEPVRSQQKARQISTRIT